jgi:hypothetical protein
MEADAEDPRADRGHAQDDEVDTVPLGSPVVRLRRAQVVAQQQAQGILKFLRRGSAAVAARTDDRSRAPETEEPERDARA